MKILPPALRAHLGGAATTLCWCWKLTRGDGVRLGFTDHDRELAFDGVTYEAGSGFTASEIRDAAGLGVDDLEAGGALSSGRLDEAELAAGLFDGAAVEIWRVNWTDVAQRVLMRKGSLGEVRRGPAAFTAEVRGLAHHLNQENGRLFQYACDAELGDARCGIDAGSPPWRAAGAVVSPAAPWRFTASGLQDHGAGPFVGGLLTWTSGLNAGARFEVKNHALAEDAGAAIVELWRPAPRAIAPGDAFTVAAGCDKRFATCRDRFANAVNFRGFPHMPGNDFVIRTLTPSQS